MSEKPAPANLPEIVAAAVSAGSPATAAAPAAASSVSEGGGMDPWTAGINLAADVLELFGEEHALLDARKARTLELELSSELSKARENQDDEKVAELRKQVPIYQRSASQIIQTMKARKGQGVSEREGNALHAGPRRRVRLGAPRPRRVRVLGPEAL
jgi:hypothetical protein